jgi:hypothetical protein
MNNLPCTKNNEQLCTLQIHVLEIIKYTTEYTLYIKHKEHLYFQVNIHQLVAEQGRSSQP